MASLLRAVTNWVRGVRDDAAESLADPVRDGKFAIEDAEKECKGFESKIANVIASRKGMEKQAQDAGQEVKKWQSIAERAATAGSENDAREALSKKSSAQSRLQGLESEIAKTKSVEQKLRSQLEATRARIAKAKSTHALHAARLEGAKVRQAAQGDASSFGSSLAALDDLEKRADEAESQAEAWEELTEEPGGHLEEKYSGAGAEVEDELAQLMQKHSK